jgi:hypothetical protein
MSSEIVRTQTGTVGALPASGFVRLPVIIGTGDTPGVYPVGKTSWYRGIKEGRYPAPVQLGPRAVGWRVEDIRDLIQGAA